MSERASLPRERVADLVLAAEEVVAVVDEIVGRSRAHARLRHPAITALRELAAAALLMREQHSYALSLPPRTKKGAA